MDEQYNKHYITIDSHRRITDGWSDAFRSTSELAICIREQGGYQFRLFPDGEENPQLTNITGKHLWYWEDGVVRAATVDELEAEYIPLFPATPTLEQRTEALESALLTMMTGGMQ